VAQCLDAEADEVGGAGQFHGREHGGGALDEGAEGDGEDEDVAAKEVAQDIGERGAAAVGEGAADDEQDARAGDRDYDEGHRGERENAFDGHHGPVLPDLCRTASGRGAARACCM
jgi:hypothetical protein